MAVRRFAFNGALRRDFAAALAAGFFAAARFAFVFLDFIVLTSTANTVRRNRFRRSAHVIKDIKDAAQGRAARSRPAPATPQ